MLTIVFLLLAGFGAGLVGYLSGLASLISYPAMVALGIPPVLANTSNTVGLLGSGLGSTVGAWKALRKITEYPLWLLCGIAVVGGALGGVLVLAVDSAVFEAVVPWLVLLGALTVLFSPRLKRLGNGVSMTHAAFYVLLFLVTIYGGYFGAGAGVLLLATCSLGTPLTTNEAVILKSPLLAIANLAAAIFFIAQGQVDWTAAICIGIGSLVGGYIGPFIQRFFSDEAMRWIVAIGGLIMTIWLLVR